MKFSIKIFIIFLFLLSYANAEKILNIGNGAEPSSLDPALSMGIWDARILNDNFASLYMSDGKGGIIKELATSYTLSKDKLTYIFKIRNDAKWSDGKPLTAYDIEYSIKRVLNPNTGSGYADLLFDIQNAKEFNYSQKPEESVGVRAINSTTIMFKLTHPVAYFLDYTTLTIMTPVPKHIVEKFGKNWTRPENIVSSGAYKIIDRNVGESITSIKNPYYFNAKLVKIDKIKYFTGENHETLVNLFRTGAIDIMPLSTTYYRKFKDENSPLLRKSTSLSVAYIPINTSLEKFKDIRVRKALAMAINRESLIRIRNGDDSPAYSFSPNGLGYYTPPKYEWEKLPYSDRLEEAKKLLTEAGYTKENPLNIEFTYGTIESQKQIFVSILNDWKDLPINLVGKSTEVKTVYANLGDGKFDMSWASWDSYIADPYMFLYLFLSNNPQNFSRLKNEKLDEILVQSNLSSGNARIKKLLEAETIALNDYSQIPLYFGLTKKVISDRVMNYYMNIPDRHPVQFLDLKSN